MNFAPRKEITPRYLDLDLLTSQNLNELHRILVRQDLIDFVRLRDYYYPDLVAIAYNSLIMEFEEVNSSSFTIFFSLGTNKYVLNVGSFCEISSLSWHETLFKNGDKPPEDWKYDRNEACRFFNLDPNCGNKMPTNPMSDEHRLLHYLLVWVIMPRNHNHGVVMNDDLVIMRALCSDVKINWSYFIAHHMAKIKDGPTTSRLGYVILWTRIFKYFNIDLSNTLQKGLKGPNCINYETLRQMGRGLAQIETQPQQAPQDHQEFQAGPSEQSSEQPSMRDLM
ncbi:hypothetical protein PIB30_064144 [Stylosanthes scabra]|uniref:Aminotransferase-like plant mobile domain-containing protein n=1 Tax=Stylosanthes scabra TaxID=79078 RepID=A0ABU6SMM5_9FABA|nr:hypothetical protein [Stylosanthes scabra]